jgi:hypothetical protein
MKKLLLFSILTFLSFEMFAQNTEEIIEEYKNSEYFKINGSDIVVSKIIEELPETKNDIYIKVRSYFATAYKDAKSVIQMDDKEAGIIIGKGVFSNVYYYSANFKTVPVTYSAYHTLRVDIKDGRARVICSVSSWSVEWNAPRNYMNNEYPILSYAPFTKNKIYGSNSHPSKAFVELIDRMQNAINSLEESLKSTSINENTEDW